MITDDCFKKRLLRKTKPDSLKVTKTLEMAKLREERAQELFKNDFFEELIISSYIYMGTIINKNYDYCIFKCPYSEMIS